MNFNPLKRVLQNIFLFVLFLPFIAGCEYKTDEIYNRKVNPDVTPPNIQVVNLNMDADTIYLYADVTFRFRFKAGNQSVKRVTFSIDGDLVGTVNSDSGSIVLPYHYLLAGIHNLIVKIYTTTGSGSLAEEFDEESFVETRSWILVYLKNGYNLNISSSVENGLLHLRWNKYLSANLKEYVVYRRNEAFDYIEIKKTRLNEFIDSSYVGEYANYEVKLIIDDNSQFSWDWYYKDAEPTEMSMTMENPVQFLVKWKRPRYYNAVDTFILMQGLADSQNGRYRVKATTNPDDTVFQVVTGSFGDNMSFNLKLVPRKKIAGINSPSANAGGYITGYLGYSFDKNDMWELFPAGQDGFIYYDCENIKRFSFSQRKTSDELKYQMTGCYGCLAHSPHISNTGKYLSNIVGCESSLLLAKTSDLNSYSLHNLGTITGSFYYYLSLADNGTALMHNANGGYDLYNAVSSTHIGHYDHDYNYQSQLKISADGSYFTIGYDSLRMIKVSGNSFSEMWKIKYSQSYLKYYEFNPANPDQMIFWEGSRLVTKSCSDLSVISSIPLADNILLNIDYENNELLSFKTGHLYVRSLTDGSVKYDIPFNVNPDHWYNKCLLINHTIVSAMGVMYFLQ